MIDEVAQARDLSELARSAGLGGAVVVLSLVIRFLFGRLEAARAEMAALVKVKDERIEELQRESAVEAIRSRDFAVAVMESQTRVLTEQQGTMRQVERVLDRAVAMLGKGDDA